MTRYVMILESMGLPSEISKRLEQFNVLFLKWNERINLSAAKTSREVDEHILDSLHVVPHLQGLSRVLDVGSGGGLPVVVAAICLPMTSFVALEPVHKKHAFLRTAARELDLKNLEAFPLRVEDHEAADYDAAMSRATFDIVEWLTRGLALVNETGIVLGFEAIPRDDLPPNTERHSYDLEGKQRSIVLCRKRPT